MKPEDVKISYAVPWPVQPGIIIPEKYIPAHEAGAIIKAAMSAVLEFGWLGSFEYTQEQENRIRENFYAWLAKADELERLK